MTPEERLDDRTRRRTIEMRKLLAAGYREPVAIARAIQREESRVWKKLQRAADRRAANYD
jgi:hypothetical protein